MPRWQTLVPNPTNRRTCQESHMYIHHIHIYTCICIQHIDDTTQSRTPPTRRNRWEPPPGNPPHMYSACTDLYTTLHRRQTQRTDDRHYRRLPQIEEAVGHPSNIHRLYTYTAQTNIQILHSTNDRHNWLMTDTSLYPKMPPSKITR